MRGQWIKAGLAAGLVFGLGGAEVRRFERIAADDIRSKLQGERVQVSVHTRPNGLLGYPIGDLRTVTIRASQFSTPELPLFTEPDRSKKGRVRNLEIQLADFSLGALAIESLSAKIPNCRFDFGLAMRERQIRLSEAGTGAGTVRIREEALEKFILAKFHEIKEVDVRCDRGWVWVEGYGEFLIIATRFRVLAKLEALDGSKLVLARARIAFDGLPADPIAAQALLDTLNPVVDLDKDLRLHGAIRVESVDIGDGVLTAAGAATIPILPQSKPPAGAAERREHLIVLP